MRLNIIKVFSVIFLIFPLQLALSQEVTTPSVKIEDHIKPVPNTGVIDIDCYYEFLPNNAIGLTAVFPELKKTDKYTVEGIDYNPIGGFNEGDLFKIATGTRQDDVFSSAVNLPFNFCYYGKTYSSFVLSDNGVLSFNTAYAGGECPFAPSASIPHGLPRNSIFGVFHDLNLLERGEVRMRTEGIAPNRKFIVNFDSAPQYSYDIKGKESTTQIVLYETSNIIDVYVKDRYKNGDVTLVGMEAYKRNAAIGLTNATSSEGIAPASRDSGNWEAKNEAWRFTPAGDASQTIIWRKDGVEVSGTRNQKTIQVFPTSDTKYKVEVIYSICDSYKIEDEIEVKFSQDFPTAKEVDTEVFCVNNGESYTLDLTAYEAQMNPDASLSFTYFEDSNLNTPISLAAAKDYTFNQNKTIYVKVLKSGVCLSIGKLNLKINSRPVIPENQSFIKCDVGNDGIEKINLNGLGISGLAGTRYKFFETEAAAIAGTPEVNASSYTLDVNGIPDASKEFFVRAWNNTYNDMNCYSIASFTIKLEKFIELEDVEDKICYVDEGQILKGIDLTVYESELLPTAVPGAVFKYYSSSSYNNYYLIANPSSADIKMNAVIYVEVTANGYCNSRAKISIEADYDCASNGGGGGGGGGGSGSGGGTICGTDIEKYTVKLDQDYLQYYLGVDLELGDITITGFYDAHSNDVITETSPYTYTFEVPHYKVVKAKFVINKTGKEVQVNFPIRASNKAEIDPDTFDICDTYKQGLSKEILELLPEYEEMIQSKYEGGADVRFFDSHDELAANIADPKLNNNITQIELTTSGQTTVYVLVRYYGCTYEHELFFNLIPLDTRFGDSFLICDFDDDNEEVIDLTVYNSMVISKLTPVEQAKLEQPFHYYTTEPVASVSPDSFIEDPLEHKIHSSEMSVFARLNIEGQCPVFVEIEFEFTTSVALPDYKEETAICDESNDGQEIDYNINSVIENVDASSKVSFFTRKDAAETNDTNYIIGYYDEATPLLYDITTVPDTKIYMRVYDETTGCIAVRLIHFTLIGYPEINNSTIDWCDFENDGIEEIKVSGIQEKLIKNNLGILDDSMTYAFFETKSQALDPTSTPLTEFEATDTNSIWVRITRDDVGCPMTYELDFKLSKSPILSSLSINSLICNNNTGNNGGVISELIDLDTFREEVVGGPFTNDFEFSYYSDQAAAIEGGSNGLLQKNYTITSFPTTIWVRVYSKGSTCFSVKDITIDQYESLEGVINDTDIITCSFGAMNVTVDLEEYPKKMIDSLSNNLSDFEVTYHISRANAVNNIEITSNINDYLIEAGSEVWIKFVDKRSKGSGCYIIKKLSVIIYDSPKASSHFIPVCDESDGVLDGCFVIADLDDYRNKVIKGENITVIEAEFPFTYYRTYEAAVEQDATYKIEETTDFTFLRTDLTPGDDTDPDIYEIFARIDKVDGSDCFEVVSLFFMVNKQVTTEEETPIITSCQILNTKGIAEFDLSEKNEELSSELNLTYKYYLTEEDAKNDKDEILNHTAWTNTEAYEQTIYVRISSIDKCDVIVPKKVQVYFIDVEDYDIGAICEIVDGEGIETKIDLTSYLSAILTDVTDPIKEDLLVSFHNTNADAEANTNEIGNYDIVSPTTDLALTEYLPDVGPTTLYLRFSSKTTDCYVVKELKMDKLAAPEITDLPDIVVCDENLNGVFDDFVLNTLDNSLVASVSDYEITYHPSIKEAWENTGLIDKDNAWVMPSNPPLTIAVRVVSKTTSCVNTQEITFITNEVIPLKVAKNSLQQCDENIVGEAGFNDGKSEFDLTSLEDDFVTALDLGSLPAGEEIVFSYYTSKEDASLEINPISNPTAYTNSTIYKETIYVRISAEAYCDVLAEIELIVTPSILAKDYDLGAICEFVDGEGIETKIDLTSYLSAILEDVTDPIKEDLLVSFHNTNADANGNTNEIGNYDIVSPITDLALTEYLPDVGPTTLYLRFSSKTTDCYVVKELKMDKLAAPEITDLPDIVVCDENLNGVFDDFVLNSLDKSLVTSVSDYEITYHPSIKDAWGNTGLIDKDNAWVMPSNPPLTIAVRVVSKTTSCVNTQEITFITNEVIPLKVAKNSLQQCDENIVGEAGFNDGKSVFDLTSLEDDFVTALDLGSLPAGEEIVFSYYTSKEDASLEMNPINNPEVYTNSTIYKETVYVRISAEAYCDVLGEIELIVTPSILAKDYDLGAICEFVDGEGGETKIDLTSYLSAILADVTDPIKEDLLVSFHNTNADADGNTNEIGNYDIVSPITDLALTEYLPAVGSTTLYLRFSSKTTDCYVVKELKMDKLAAPEITDLPDIVVCDEDLNGVFDDFVLNTLDKSLVASVSDYEITYHPSIKEAWENTGLIDKDNAWVMPSNPPLTIAVRVVSKTTSCVNTQEITFITNEVIPLKVAKNSLQQCDENIVGEAGFNDGLSVFDLTSLEDDFVTALDLGSLPVGEEIVFSYYTSKEDASLEMNPINNPEAYTNSTIYKETVYVRISAEAYCDVLGEIELIVTPSILAKDYDLGAICEFVDGEGGETKIDLTSYLSAILADVTDPIKEDLLVSFHNTNADAEGNINEIGNYDIVSPVTDLALTEYLPAVGPTTLYLRFSSKTTDCYVVKELKMDKLAAPEITDLPDIVVCDEDLNGVFDDFVLNTLDNSLVTSVSDYEITYHPSIKEAWENTGLIDKDNAWVMPSNPPLTIAVRVVSKTTSCVNTQEITFITNEVIPLKVAKNSLQQCDENIVGEAGFNDGLSVFDLTSLEDDFVTALDLSSLPAGEEIVFSYYTSIEDASLEMNPISNPEAYTNSTIYKETIYVRISAEAYCDVLGEIELIVTPSILAKDSDLGKFCEYVNATNKKTKVDLTSNLPEMLEQVKEEIKNNLLISFHITAEDAEDKLNSIGDYDVANPIKIKKLQEYTPVLGESVIYLRFTDKTTGCYVIRELTINVLESPVESFSTTLMYCDPNNDEEGTFFLPDAIPSITSETDVNVSFHRTLADANNNVNPLPETINNNILGEGPQQVVYVRVTRDGLSCYNIAELLLLVEKTPVLVKPDALVACDIDATGEHVFDLEKVVLEQVVVELEDLSDYIISYYANEEDLENLIQIPVPSAYLSKDAKVIIVVENIHTGCSTSVELELIISPMPVVYPPTPLELCDVNNQGDEREYFNLEDAVAEITGGDTSLKVSFHRTQRNADADVNSLVSPYLNIVNNQTIYIRVVNEYGCVVTTGITLTLVVNPLPAPVVPPVYEVCDVDNEGFVYFDLESLRSEIIAKEPDVSLTFHETYIDAIDGIWEIDTNYQNIVSGEQVIYARVYFDDPPKNTGCFKVVEVVLKAVKTPKVPIKLDDLYFCVADMATGISINLKVYEDAIYGGQDRSNLDLSYHLSEEDAKTNTNPIATPEDYLLSSSSPAAIYARLGFVDGECSSIVSFNLHRVLGPQLNVPSPLNICTPIGEPNTGTAVFDLLDRREEIVGTATGLELLFYEKDADALAGLDTYITNPTAYTNIENPQLIYVRVVDSQENEGEDTGCVAFTLMKLHVDPNPEPVSPDPIEVCQLDTELDYSFVDLTVREDQILNHEFWDLEYYESYRDALLGDDLNAIDLPEYYKLSLETGSTTIYVRVINPTSGCFEIVSLDVILSELPEMLPPEAIDPLIACYVGDRISFDLTQKIPDIFGTQNLEGLEVYFFEDLGDAIDGKNKIINPEVYYNRDNPQTIYVGVGNPEIESCFIGGLTWFTIEVRDGAVAHSPSESIKVCSKPGEDQWIGDFYLGDRDLIESILGIQDPAFFDVYFYLTLEEAHKGSEFDTLPAYYTNVTSPQTIFARVVNQSTGCYAIAEVVLEVVPLEDLILEDLYSLCTDELGELVADENGNILYPIIDTGLDPATHKFSWFYEGTRILGQTSPSLEAKDLGVYTVEILNLTTGCTLTAEVEVVRSAPPHTFGAKVTTPAFSGKYDIIAWAEGDGDYWFSLDSGDFQEKGFWENVSVGTHIVTIMDKNGCGSIEILVSVIDYPKFFTPNDDGYNDTWNIPGMADLDPAAEIFIFDRQGKLLKQISPLGEGWDGNFNGSPLPSSDYWFVVKYQEEGVSREFKAHFSLKR